MREVPFIRKADDFALGTTSHLAQSSSASRLTAGTAGFLLLTQCRDRPERRAKALRYRGRTASPSVSLIEVLYYFHKNIDDVVQKIAPHCHPRSGA
jgi:hypothetical protein